MPIKLSLAWLENKMRAFIQTGFAAAILALSGVIAGAFASIYTAEIKAGGIECFLFFAACLIFFILVATREYILGGTTKQYQKDLLQAVLTMPPQNLLYIYNKLYLSVSETAQKALAIPDTEDKKEKLGDAIRLTLDGLCTLIAAFENYPDDAVYSGNIMIYRPIESIDTLQARDDILNRLHFTQERTLDGLMGILDLRMDLSNTSSMNNSFAKDDSLTPFALPIPENESNVIGKSKLLPGAPTAFIKKSCLIEDTAGLGDFAQERCDVAPGIVQDIRLYFEGEPKKNIGSILSISLGHDYGVFNLHCSRTNILSDKNKLYMYINIMAPLTEILERLLSEELKSE